MIRVQRKTHRLIWWLLVPVLGFVLYLAIPASTESEQVPVRPSIEGDTFARPDGHDHRTIVLNLLPIRYINPTPILRRFDWHVPADKPSTDVQSCHQ